MSDKPCCPNCGFESEEIPIPDEYDAEAGRFFFDAIVAAGSGHYTGNIDARLQWQQISEDTRRCFGHAASAFKKRYCCEA